MNTVIRWRNIPEQHSRSENKLWRKARGDTQTSRRTFCMRHKSVTQPQQSREEKARRDILEYRKPAYEQSDRTSPRLPKTTGQASVPI